MKTLLTAALILGFAVAVTVRLYQVEEADYGYSLLWNAEGAVLIVASKTVGRNATIAGWVVQTLMAVAGYWSAADDVHSRSDVLQIRPAGVERFSADGVEPGIHGVPSGRISDGRVTWDGTRFVTATDEERHLSALRIAPEEFTDEKGWSKRSAVGCKTAAIPFAAAGKPATLKIVGAYGEPAEIIQDRDGKSESLWKIDPKPSLVSGETYRKAFAAKAR